MTEKKTLQLASEEAARFVAENPNLPEHIKSLILSEGIVNTVYKDSLGKKTIGIGHLLTGEEKKSGKVYGYDITKPLSDKAIYDILNKDYEARSKDAEVLLKAKGIESKNLSDSQRHAINEMVFQLGKSGASKFNKTFKYIKEGNWEEAAQEVARGSGGKPSNWATQTPKRILKFQNRIRKAQQAQPEVQMRGPQSMEDNKLLTPEQRVALKKKLEEERKKQARAENDAFMEEYKAKQEAKKDKPAAVKKEDGAIDKEALFEGASKAIGKIAEDAKSEEESLRRSARSKTADAVAGLEVEKDPVANFLKRFRRS